MRADTPCAAGKFWVIESSLAALRFKLKASFNQAQPRVPAGNPDGGQWADGGGARPHAPQPIRRPEYLTGFDRPDRDAIKPADGVFLFAGGAAAALSRSSARVAAGVADILTARVLGRAASRVSSSAAGNAQFNALANSLEKWFGNTPHLAAKKNDNPVFLSRDKKFRMELNPRTRIGEEPHFHFQVLGKDKYGKPEWAKCITG